MLAEGDTFFYKGKEITVRSASIPLSNHIQVLHQSGELNVYEPVEAYSEKWITKTKKQGYWEDYVSAQPVPGTRKRSDLPPIATQWRESFGK